MFAMVTPPVLFFAHALSNYSEVFNKINTFFQKNQGFFSVFYHACGCLSSLLPYIGGHLPGKSPVLLPGGAETPIGKKLLWKLRKAPACVKRKIFPLKNSLRHNYTETKSGKKSKRVETTYVN
jgi:hypothetical protein